jgi:hypothetical protein
LHLLFSGHKDNYYGAGTQRAYRPIARMICTDHFHIATNLVTAIDVLADEIPDPQAATQFRERVYQRLG